MIRDEEDEHVPDCKTFPDVCEPILAALSDARAECREIAKRHETLLLKLVDANSSRRELCAPVDEGAEQVARHSAELFSLASESGSLQSRKGVEPLEEHSPDGNVLLRQNCFSDEDVPQFKKLGAFSDIFVKRLDGADLARSLHHVEEYYKTEGMLQAIARSHTFENFTLFVVGINAIFIGLDSDLNGDKSVWGCSTPFVLGENLFCLYFTWEINVRFGAFQRTSDALRNHWFKFDLLLVFLMVAEVWVAGVVYSIWQANLSWSVAPIRLIRLARLPRLIRFARDFPELITISRGLRAAIRAVLSTMALLFMVLYVFAITLHLLLKDSALAAKDFGTVGLCISTLFFEGALLDSPARMIRNLLDGGTVEFVGVAIFILFMFGAAIMMMNLLVGVLCEVVTTVTKDERNEAAVNYIKDTILQNLMMHDEDCSGTISNEELTKVIDEPLTAFALKELDIDLAYLSEFKDLLFDDVNKEIPHERAVEMFLLCRGEELASVTTIAHQYSLIRMLVQTESSKLKAFMRSEVGLVRRRSTASVSRASTQDIDTGIERDGFDPLPEGPKPVLTIDADGQWIL